jgi:hypothetical protein
MGLKPGRPGKKIYIRKGGHRMKKLNRQEF